MKKGGKVLLCHYACNHVGACSKQQSFCIYQGWHIGHGVTNNSFECASFVCVEVLKKHERGLDSHYKKFRGTKECIHLP